MRFTRVITAAVAVTLVSTVAGMAQPKIYAYNSSHNFCPAGLQPVTMDGAICCGQPNQPISYQQAMSHPVAKRKVHVRREATRRADCPVGTKGCTFD